MFESTSVIIAVKPCAKNLTEIIVLKACSSSTDQKQNNVTRMAS